MSDIEGETQTPEPLTNMEERCHELVAVARQWEEQMSDLRSFTELEKESLESEMAALQMSGNRLEKEKQSLENSLMVLEDERVRTCTINDLSVQAKIETEVKLQLMESALEAVSLHSMMDTHTPGCAVKTVECATGTEDLLQPEPEECPQTDQNIGNDSQQILSVNSEVDSEKLALQLEVRKLRHQLIVSQISAKQFQSECLLYKTKTKSNAKTSMKKKRKDFSLSSNIPQGPTRQCARFSSGPDTPRQALASIENKLRLPGFNESIRKRSTKGENNCERKPTSTAAHSVNIIDASDTFSGICLRM